MCVRKSGVTSPVSDLHDLHNPCTKNNQTAVDSKRPHLQPCKRDTSEDFADTPGGTRSESSHAHCFVGRGRWWFVWVLCAKKSSRFLFVSLPRSPPRAPKPWIPNSKHGAPNQRDKKPRHPYQKVHDTMPILGCWGRLLPSTARSPRRGGQHTSYTCTSCWPVAQLDDSRFAMPTPAAAKGYNLRPQQRQPLRYRTPKNETENPPRSRPRATHRCRIARPRARASPSAVPYNSRSFGSLVEHTHPHPPHEGRERAKRKGRHAYRTATKIKQHARFKAHLFLVTGGLSAMMPSSLQGLLLLLFRLSFRHSHKNAVKKPTAGEIDVTRAGRQKLASSWSVKLDRVGIEVGNEGGGPATFGVRACVRQSLRSLCDRGESGGEIDGEEYIWRDFGFLMKTGRRVLITDSLQEF